ncbi:MAG: hypothetical protein NVS2B8_03240 [Vulcanimicrobiaceae bacterium]
MRPALALALATAFAGCSGGAGTLSSSSAPLTMPAAPATGAIAPANVPASSLPLLGDVSVLATGARPLSITQNFAANFSGTVNSAAPGWTTASGDWKLCTPADGTNSLCQFKSSDGVAQPPIAGQGNLTDYSVETSAYRDPASRLDSGVALLGRIADRTHFYQLEIRGDVANSGKLYWYVWKYDGTTWGKLAGGPVAQPSTPNYRLRLGFAGDTITASMALDGASTLVDLGSVHDGSYPKGGVALRTWNTADAHFSTLVVTSGSNAAPTASPTAGASSASAAPAAPVAPAPTAAPTTTPIAQQPAVQVQPPAGNSANLMAGCSMYSGDPRLTADVTNAPVSSASASQISTAARWGKFNTMGDGDGYLLHVLPNASAEPTTSLTQQKSYHSFPGPFPIGQFTNQSSLTGVAGDRPMEMIGLGYSNPGGCKVFDGYNLTYIGTQGSYSSSNMWSAYSACISDPSGNMVSETCNSNASLSGIEIAAGLMPEQLAANPPPGWSGLNHALLMETPGIAGDGTISESGVKVRLHANYPDPDPRTNPQAAKIVYAMKHYGVILSDNGCCLNIARHYLPQPGHPSIDFNDVNAVITRIGITDFDVLAVP